MKTAAAVILALLVGLALGGPLGYLFGNQDAFTRARYEACMDFANVSLADLSDEQYQLMVLCEEQYGERSGSWTAR